MQTTTNRIIISVLFLIICGCLGFFYFNYLLFYVKQLVWWSKYWTLRLFGIEMARGIFIFKPLPPWANTAFGSIVGWGLKEFLLWVYNKFLKDKFKKK